MTDFNTQVIEALFTPSNQDPFIVQLRNAIDSIDGDNQDQISALVDDLLANHPASPQPPMTFDELMQRLVARSTQPSQQKKLNDLSTQLSTSTIKPPSPKKPSKLKRSAYGLGPVDGFTPSAGNEFYDVRLTFEAAMAHIVKIFRKALAAVGGWDPKTNHTGFMDFLRKAKNAGHPIRCIRRDVWFVCEFVYNGRAGWNLIDIPHRFYEDLLPILNDFVKRTLAINADANSSSLRDIVSWAHQTGVLLHALRVARVKTEQASKAEYMRAQGQLEKAKFEGEVQAMYEGMEKMGLKEKGATVDDILGIEALELGAGALDEEEEDELVRAIQREFEGEGITMEQVKKPTTFLSLELEVQQLVFEGLFSQSKVLHIPERESATISALCAANKSLRKNFTEYAAEREKLTSVRTRYTKCVFTVSPDVRVSAPPSPNDWPHIKDIVIMIDDLALEDSYCDNWDDNPELVRSQVAGMVADLDAFVAWAAIRHTPLTSLRVRFTNTEDASFVFKEHVATNGRCVAPVAHHLLSPLVKLPSCKNTIVKQSRGALDGILGIDDGLERIDEWNADYEVGFKYAVQGWLRLSAEERERYEFDDVAGDLSDAEMEKWRRRASMEEYE
ncbi:hypothetical protein PRZ48_001933 [Zasmidium cellare]|uniref:Uncharacterized protein n=1 Tax=Zasmidium cellare TaxID=395010 RepID=A0ABR0F474_ZASCE|nr:hypothetical protein PRZ48_001933 [Zasmidium cellare]